MSSLPVIVFSGPSGAGKSTLLKMFLKIHSNYFAFSVSHTTREKRPTEENGKDYHFVDHESFRQAVSEGHFLEFAEFAGNKYGTTRAAVQTVLDSCRICLLDVDLAGVKNIHAVKPPLFAKYILIRPSSIAALKERLVARGTETADAMARRLDRAREDLEFCDSDFGRKLFDHVIINDKLEEAYDNLEAILLPWVDLIKTGGSH